jgi:hypothetical protein
VRVNAASDRSKAQQASHAISDVAQDRVRRLQENVAQENVGSGERWLSRTST